MTNRVLITGATGLIGRGICSELGAEHDVILTARNISDLSSSRFYPFDLSQTAGIKNFLDSLQPKVIVHTAALTSIDEVAKKSDYAQLLNVEATREVANWCEENDARMIHFSTDFVFDGTRFDYTENDEPHPVSSYGKMKWESELAVSGVLKNYLIIRPILVYGYFDNMARLNFPLLVLSKLQKGEEMFITSDQVRMPTHVSDIARVVKKALFSEYTGCVHLSGSELINMYDLALKVADVFQLDASLLQPIKTSNEAENEHRPKTSGFNFQKAKELFNYRPLTIDQGLRLLPISIG